MLNITIDRESKEHIYVQLYKQILAKIISGEYPEDYLIPTVDMMVKELGIGKNAVLEAIKCLKEEGYVQKSRYGMLVKINREKGRDKVLEDFQFAVGRARLKAFTKEELIQIIEQS